MKKIAIILVALMAAIACEKTTETVEKLKVTYNDVAGSWKLVSFDEGNNIGDGTFHYINLDRRTKEFQTYSNLNSQYPVRKIGEYQLSETEEGDNIIRGLYTMEVSKEWDHKYVITELTEDRMVWVAQDDNGIVNVYVRAEIPEEIINSFPSEE